MSGRRAILATLALLGVALAASPRAVAGPQEARTLLKKAQSLGDAPWRSRVLAWRAVRAEAGPADPVLARALAAEARVLRDAGRDEAACAAEAAAARWGPERDPDRLGHALSAARALVAEGDDAAAAPWLDDVVGNGAAATPWVTGPALALQGECAAARRDGEALDRLVARAASLVPRRYDVRLVLLDRGGLLALEQGDAAAARRALAAQRALFGEASRVGGDPARAASKTWLALDLPRRLRPP